MRRRAVANAGAREAYVDRIRELATVFGDVKGNAFAAELADLEAGRPVIVPGWALQGRPHGATYRLHGDGTVEEVAAVYLDDQVVPRTVARYRCA